MTGTSIFNTNRQPRYFSTNGGWVLELDTSSMELVAIMQVPDTVAISANGRKMYVSTGVNDLLALERVFSK